MSASADVPLPFGSRSSQALICMPIYVTIYAHDRPVSGNNILIGVNIYSEIYSVGIILFVNEMFCSGPKWSINYYYY